MNHKTRGLADQLRGYLRLSITYQAGTADALWPHAYKSMSHAVFPGMCSEMSHKSSARGASEARGSAMVAIHQLMSLDYKSSRIFYLCWNVESSGVTVDKRSDERRTPAPVVGRLSPCGHERQPVRGSSV